MKKDKPNQDKPSN